MALTPQIRSTQAGAAAVTASATTLRTTQATVRAIYNFPTEFMRSTQAGVKAVVSSTIDVRTTSALVRAVVKGLVDNPKLISWYFILDGHDFWVLRLGTSRKTLIYDLSTGQWAWWTTGDRNSWRANVGLNWRSAGSIPDIYGSNIIIGDDNYGILWVLAPSQGTDDDLIDDTDHTFPRVATGQLTTTGRNYQPIYSVQLRGSLGQPSVTANTLTLSYSDDQGNTFVVADEPIVVTAGDYAQELDWRSLGMFRSPGRLFKIEDDGALQRIDSMEVNE